MLVLESLGTIVSGSDSLTITIWPLAGLDGLTATAEAGAEEPAAAGFAASAALAASAGLAAGAVGAC
jgi:hypothetical protein